MWEARQPDFREDGVQTAPDFYVWELRQRVQARGTCKNVSKVVQSFADVSVPHVSSTTHAVGANISRFCLLFTSETELASG